MEAQQQEIERLAAELKRAHKLAVLSGAGLSAESGVPTFRGAGGLWKDHQATDLATPQAFQRDPELVWEFYNWRREKALEVEPNPAHVALAKLEELVPDFVHVTQNVDGLARRAGGRNIIEIHGDLFATICSNCRLPAPGLPQIVPYPTHCSACGGLVRPGVVWFGEPVTALDQSLSAIVGADVMLVVGTSAVVHPAASLAPVAKRGGAFVAEVNLEQTPLTGALDLAIHAPAGQTLPRVLEAMGVET